MSCPICEKETVPKYRPFCSRRCADIDLGKWLTGKYAIPSATEDEEELDEAIAEDASQADKPLH